MAEIPTGIGCPQCRDLGMTQMLYSEQLSTRGYFCRNGHRYDDLQDLQAMNPAKIPVPQKKTIQQGFEKVEMEIPSDLKGRLLGKFGTPEKLSATLSSVLMALSQPQCFLMNTEDIQAIVKHTGIEVKTSQELIGVCFSKQEEIKLLRATASDAKATNGNAPAASNGHGKLTIDVESHLGKIGALAKFRKESPEHVCESTVKMALDNGWA